jgi:simple sugar transport system permease protein
MQLRGVSKMRNIIKKVTGHKLFLSFFCLLLVLLINIVKDPSFFDVSIRNDVLFGRLIDILNRGSEIAILGVGMTLVISASRGPDISVGSVMSLSACFGCMLLAGFGVQSVSDLQMPMMLGILGGILMGGLAGAFNGTLVSKLNIQPMIATLILFTAGRAISLLLCNNMMIYIRYEPYKYLGNFLKFGDWTCPIPTPVFVTLFVVGIASIILRRTALGLYVQSVGINRRASRLLGINSAKIIFICFVISGICAGIAGAVSSSRIYSADPNNIGKDLELDAILAVALGGNSLGGGKFKLAGSIVGAYTIQAISVTLFAMGVSVDQAPVIKAIIVIAIVAVQSPVFKEWVVGLRNRRQLKMAQVSGPNMTKHGVEVPPSDISERGDS